MFTIPINFHFSIRIDNFFNDTGINDTTPASICHYKLFSFSRTFKPTDF